jgi:anti-anti-sigma factor
MILTIVRLYPADDRVVLALRGDLDHRAVGGLRAAFIAEAGRVPPPSSIIVDLSDVGHVDTAGVGSLVAGYRLCTLTGIHIAVRGVSPLIRGLLHLTSQSQASTPAAPADDEPTRCTVRRTRSRLHRLRPGTGSSGPPGRVPTANRRWRGR